MRRPSITLRLALFFAGASSLALLVVGLLIGASVERHFEEDDLVELTGKLRLTRHALHEIRSDADLASLPRTLDNALIGHHGLSIVVVASDGRTLYAPEHLPWPAPLLARPPAPADSGAPPPHAWTAEGRPQRGIVALARSGIPGAAPATVAVVLDIAHHAEFMSAFREHLWLAIGIGLLFTGPLGWIAAQRGLKPLREMAAAAHGISAERLDARIAPESLPRELSDLALSFNAMLARLEDSFRRLSDFSSDIAHELRTPINNLMMQTQVALSRARSDEEYREVLYSALEEYDRLARMIGDMLFLAKADHGLIVPHRERVALADEVRGLFDFYDALAEDEGVALALSGAGQVDGDRLMLRRALSNLIGNALRHTARGGCVEVTIAASGDSIRLSVANPGPPIAPEHLPRLFDRFYRADPARRHREGEGSGLGLAITQSIVSAHGGRIEVESAQGWTRFTVVLPACA